MFTFTGHLKEAGGNMPDYAYAAVDRQGKTFRGNLEETDQSRAIERIKEMGLFPTQVSPRSERSAPQPTNSSARPQSPPWWRAGRLSPRHLAEFTRELATLVEAGIPLVRGLRAIVRQEKNVSFQATLSQVVYDIESGSQFSEALLNQPRQFKRLYANMCMAGEQSGALDTALARLADLLERTERLKGKVIAAMFYPAAVLLVATAIIALLMIVILPQFQLIFSDLGNGQPLPQFTLFVLGLSQTIRSHALVLLGLAITMVTAVKLACRYPVARLWVDKVKLALPIFGKLYHLVALTRFCRTLSTLLQSGVPVLQSLNIVRETTGNSVLARAVDQIHTAVKEGEAFTPIMDAVPIFPATLVTMVDVGEQTGALPDMLAKAADNYDERVDNTVTGLTALIEPIMIIFLAVIVGSIVIAMFLPLIRIVQVGFDDPAREVQ
jgi:type IV pilus assembly protein PilC